MGTIFGILTVVPTVVPALQGICVSTQYQLLSSVQRARKVYGKMINHGTVSVSQLNFQYFSCQDDDGSRNPNLKPELSGLPNGSDVWLR